MRMRERRVEGVGSYSVLRSVCVSWLHVLVATLNRESEVVVWRWLMVAANRRNTQGKPMS